MAYRFLRKDYEALVGKIDELTAEYREAGEAKARAVSETSETWHDNFGFEQQERRQNMLAERLEQFVAMKDEAEIVDVHPTDEVGIGSRVAVREDRTDSRRTFVVGSYQVLDPAHDDEISYAAPFAAPFLGAAIGERREVAINGDRTVYSIVSIE